MPTLWDIEQLRSLEQIGLDKNISFVVRGGVAFRLALASTSESTRSALYDLFQLTPFTADVDLSHSGASALTTSLRNDILAVVPTAECFRWDLQSADELEESFSSEPRANLIPARMIEITGEVPEGLRDPARGLQDIRSRRFRYYRHPSFRRSRRYRDGRDLEVFSALLYLQTLAEAGIIADDQASQPGWSSAVEVFVEGMRDAELRLLLQEYPYLRSRLRRLLVNLAAAHPRRDSFVRMSIRSGLQLFVDAIADSVWPNNSLIDFFRGRHSPNGIAFCESDRVGGDVYRLEAMSSNWPSPDIVPLPELGGLQQVVALSPPLRLGPAGPDTIDASFGEKTEPSIPFQEFVHFELPDFPDFNLLNYSEIPEEDMSAFLMIKHVDDQWTYHSPPCVVQTHRFNKSEMCRAAIRINCLGLLSIAAKQGAEEVRAVLVAWRRD